LLTRGHYDLALVTMDLDPDPENSINFAPDQLPPIGQNRSFFVDRDVGVWEQAGRTHYDLAVRRKYYWLTQQRIHDAVPIHGIVWKASISALNTDLKNFKPGASNDFWNVSEWSI
jgi:ABC-type transport system substrate-binding protein